MSDSGNVISLAHIKKPLSPPKEEKKAPRRIAWSGGTMMSNKIEALQRFLAKKGGEGSLNPAQRRLLEVAKNSHKRNTAEVKLLSSDQIASPVVRASEAAEPEPALLGLPAGFGGVRARPASTTGGQGPAKKQRRMSSGGGAPAKRGRGGRGRGGRGRGGARAGRGKGKPKGGANSGKSAMSTADKLGAPLEALLRK